MWREPRSRPMGLEGSSSSSIDLWLFFLQLKLLQSNHGSGSSCFVDMDGQICTQNLGTINAYIGKWVAERWGNKFSDSSCRANLTGFAEIFSVILIGGRFVCSKLSLSSWAKWTKIIFFNFRIFKSIYRQASQHKSCFHLKNCQIKKRSSCLQCNFCICPIFLYCNQVLLRYYWTKLTPLILWP